MPACTVCSIPLVVGENWSPSCAKHRQCTSCISLRKKKLYKKDKAHIKYNATRHYWKKLVGRDVEQYRFEQLKQQNYQCAICGATKMDSRAGGKELCLDHNHETNQLRGMLCCCCNRNLATLENKSWTDAALRYLKKYDTK